VADGFVAVGVIDEGDGHVALIDCGNDPAAAAVLAALARRHLGADAVTDVLVTHGHPDHVGGCGAFPHARIHVLEADVALAEGREAAHSPIGSMMGAQPTGVHVTDPAHDGDVITLGAREARVYAIPGHTAGSAAFLVGDVLFVGDSLGVTTDGHLRVAPWIFSDDTARDRASMRALGERLAAEGRAVGTLVPAHTGVLTADPLGALSSLR
jgi:glyoxylase-like metal-dependent hydrolase (beta-lactamase superfamily II)